MKNKKKTRKTKYWSDLVEEIEIGWKKQEMRRGEKIYRDLRCKRQRLKKKSRNRFLTWKLTRSFRLKVRKTRSIVNSTRVNLIPSQISRCHTWMYNCPSVVSTCYPKALCRRSTLLHYKTRSKICMARVREERDLIKRDRESRMAQEDFMRMKSRLEEESEILRIEILVWKITPTCQT